MRIISTQENVNLNDTLTANGLAINRHRLKVNYGENSRYWAQRPLTQEMLCHAGGDVELLCSLFALQMEAAPNVDAYGAASYNYATCLAHRKCEWLPCHKPMGRFIGRGGSNIRATEKSTGCYFYGRGDRKQRAAGFLVYYPATKRDVALHALA